MILGLILAGFIFLTVSPSFATKIYIYEDPETGERYYSNIPLNEKFKVYMKLPLKNGKFSKKNNINYSAFFSAYEKIFEEVARKYELDPALLKAIAKVESNFNPRAVSPKGAMGVMQLIPSTARLVGVSDPFDPVENIHGGARYLKMLLDEFGDLKLSLAAYNAGPEAVRQYGGIPPFPETINYVKNVLEYYRALKRENL
ncbi:MAG: lytic transglycosylase domain-containing protein [Caldimicrobium sp.]